MLGRIAQSGPPPFDRRFGPTHVMEVRLGGLSNLAGGAPFSFTRASAAWAFDSSGVLRQYASGVPRIVPSPVGVMSVLREPQRTNTVANNSNFAAAVVGSPGTPPSGWYLSNVPAFGLSWSIVGTGLEDGIPYCDIRCSGTSTGASTLNVIFSGASNAAAVGEVWTASVYLRLMAGSLANLTGALQQVYFSNGGSYVSGVQSSWAGVSGAALKTQRFVATGTAPATTTACASNFQASFASGVAIDFTVRVGLPQCEKGEFATSPIMTTGSAVTRATDSISMAVGRFVPMTMFLDCQLVGQRTDQAQVLVSWDDATSSRWGIYQEITAGRPFSTITTSAGVTQMQTVIGNSTTSARHRVALAFAENDAAAVLDGGSVVTDSACVAPAAATTVRLGEYMSSFNQSAFWIHGFRLYPSRLSNAQLQALTTL